jgi:hypothetical protein
MPGIATPQLLNYAEIVDVDLDATNDVNFADVEDYGHRVVVEMNTAALNNYLGWERAVGSARPHAKLTAANEAAFKGAIEAALAGGFVDIDGVTGGLHFGTANLDTNPDPRKRAAEGVGANDLPLCFVLYKLYGSSAATTLDRIYNLEDAHAMLSNATVATAIAESFKAAEAGAVDTMFRDLLSADPHRFFDASGIPEVGIFETNADISGAGSWKMVADDTLEIKLKMIFHSRVTRRGVAGQEHNLSSTAVENQAASQANQQTVINPDDYFYVRLQLKSTPEAGAGGGNVAAAYASVVGIRIANPSSDIDYVEYVLKDGQSYQDGNYTNTRTAGFSSRLFRTTVGATSGYYIFPYGNEFGSNNFYSTDMVGGTVKVYYVEGGAPTELTVQADTLAVPTASTEVKAFSSDSGIILQGTFIDNNEQVCVYVLKPGQTVSIDGATWGDWDSIISAPAQSTPPSDIGTFSIMTTNHPPYPSMVGGVLYIYSSSAEFIVGGVPVAAVLIENS